MRRCRSSHILTGLPDAYGRGRIIGDYRRSGGAILTMGNSSITMGAVAAFRSLPLQDVGEAGDFDPGREVRYLRLNFIVGFNFTFN